MSDENVNIIITIREDGSRVVKRNMDDIAASADKSVTPIQRMTNALKSVVMPASTKQAMDATKTSAEQLGVSAVAMSGKLGGASTAVKDVEQVAVSRFGSFKNVALGAFDATRDAAYRWSGAFKNTMLNAYDTVRDAGAYWGRNFGGFLGIGGAAKVAREGEAVEKAGLKIRNSATVFREIFVILREISVGNFTRLAGSVTILATALGLMQTVLIPLAIAAGLAAAGMELFKISIQSDADTKIKNYANSLGLTSKEMRKLGDESVSAKGKLEKFDALKLTFGDVFHGLTKTIEDEFNIEPALKSMKSSAYDAAVEVASALGDSAAEVYAAYMTTADLIKKVWSGQPTFFAGIFHQIANEGWQIFEDMVNDIIHEVNRLDAAIHSVVGGAAVVAPDVKLYRPYPNEGDGKDLQKAAKDDATKYYDEFKKGEKQFLADWKKNSEQAGVDRAKRLADAIKANRNPSNRDPKTQADYINDETTKLNKEIASMTLLKDAREEQSKLDSIEEAFIKRRMPLDEAQIKVFADKIHVIQEYKYQQAEMDRLNDQFNTSEKVSAAAIAAATDLLGRKVITTKQYALALAEAKAVLGQAKDPTGASAPLDDYKVKLAQIDVALENFTKSNGAYGISQAQANEQTLLASRAYQQAIDPLFSLNEQVDAATVAAGLYGRALEDNNFYEQVRQAFLNKGIALSAQYVAGQNAEVDAIIKKNRALQEQLRLQNALKGVIDPNAQGPQGDQYILANARKMYSEIDKMRNGDVAKERAANEAKRALDRKLMEVKLSNASTFFGNLATLSTSKNKEIAAIGKAAAIAQATIDGIAAVQKALAAYPPPWNIAIAASIGVMTAANVAKIAGIGFEQGGYTGDMDSRQVAGVVHGREYVFDANATSRIGVRNLEALRLGRNSPSGGTTPPPSGSGRVTVHQHPGTEVEVRERTDGEIEVIARRVVHKEAPKVNQKELADPNSPTSRALNRHTAASRKRSAG